MSFVARNLMPGETIAHRGRIHWNVYVKPLLALAAAIAVTIVVPREFAPVAAAAALPVLAWLLAVHVRRRASEFAITNRRLIVKQGVLRQTSFETMLSKVEGIQVHQGLLDRMLDCGTLVFTGTGGQHTEFKNIAAPLEFRRQAQITIEALEHARSTGATLDPRASA